MTWKRPTAKEREELKQEIYDLYDKNREIFRIMEEKEEEARIARVQKQDAFIERTKADFDNIMLEKRLNFSNNVNLFQLAVIIGMTVLILFN